MPGYVTELVSDMAGVLTTLKKTHTNFREGFTLGVTLKEEPPPTMKKYGSVSLSTSSIKNSGLYMAKGARNGR